MTKERKEKIAMSEKIEAKKRQAKTDSILEKEFHVPEEAKPKTYILKNEIKNYIGKIVTYEVKIFEGIAPSKKTISAIDQSNGHIVYSDGGFDLISEYGKTYVYSNEND